MELTLLEAIKKSPSGRRITELDQVRYGAVVVEHYDVHRPLDDMERLRLARVLVGMDVALRGNRDHHFMQRIVTGLVGADPHPMSRIAERQALEKRKIGRTDAPARILRHKHFFVDLAQGRPGGARIPHPEGGRAWGTHSGQ